MAEVADDRWFTDAGRYTESFVRLRACWQAAIADGTLDPVDGLKRLRQSDDRGRRLMFGLLSMIQQEDRGVHTEWHELSPSQQPVMDALQEQLGPPTEWLPSYKRYISNEIPRLVLIPTWACELRCRYCYIPKQSGREMPLATMKQAVIFDVLGAPEVMLHSQARHHARQCVCSDGLCPAQPIVEQEHFCVVLQWMTLTPNG